MVDDELEIRRFLREEESIDRLADELGWTEHPPEGRTPSDRCTECRHTRYVHPPQNGCDVGIYYYMPSCTCSGFKEPIEKVTE